MGGKRCFYKSVLPKGIWIALPSRKEYPDWSCVVTSYSVARCLNNNRRHEVIANRGEKGLSSFEVPLANRLPGIPLLLAGLLSLPVIYSASTCLVILFGPLPLGASLLPQCKFPTLCILAPLTADCNAV